MNQGKLGATFTIRRKYEQAKKLWALALAHKKISIAAAVVVVLIIISL